MTVLAIDIGGTAIKVGKISDTRKLTSFGEYENDGTKGGPALIKHLFEIIDAQKGYSAIGVSTAGQVDSDSGTIIFANDNIPHYTGTPLKKMIEERYKVPVAVENDMNAAALGERYFGAGRSYQTFICLTYGTGIGGAIIINSNVYKGLNGVAGEFGHMLVHPHGLACKCGKAGCYESYASTTALLKKAKEIDMRFYNGKIVFQHYDEGYLPIQEIVHDWINEVAIGITSLVHIFNPPAIIIGGGIMEQKKLIDKIEKKVQSMIMPSFAEVKILPAALGNKAGLFGAASLHLSNILTQ
jgi:glucokinase